MRCRSRIPAVAGHTTRTPHMDTPSPVTFCTTAGPLPGSGTLAHTFTTQPFGRYVRCISRTRSVYTCGFTTATRARVAYAPHVRLPRFCYHRTLPPHTRTLTHATFRTTSYPTLRSRYIFRTHLHGTHLPHHTRHFLYIYRFIVLLYFAAHGHSTYISHGYWFTHFSCYSLHRLLQFFTYPYHTTSPPRTGSISFYAYICVLV